MGLREYIGVKGGGARVSTLPAPEQVIPSI
jgi:hypothetical protein